MLKVGDIVLIERYKSDNKTIRRHSFVILSDENGVILGMDFDFIGLVMSSIKNDEQKRRKLDYPGNFPIVPDDVDVPEGNSKDAYVKTEQFYYFRKDTIDYRVIGKMDKDIFNLMVEFIETEMDAPIVRMLENLDQDQKEKS